MQDLRRNKRIDYREHIMVNNIVKTLGASLSEGGFFLSTGYYFSPDSIINVEMPLSRTTLRAKAKVCHAQKDIGIGATFLDLTALQREMLSSYVNSRLANVSNITNKRILHIDADPMKRKLYKGKLVSDGYIVFEASTGTDALRLMTEKDMDLVIMEIYYSDTDGLSIISTIRDNLKWKHIPIIVLSAKGILYDIKRAKENGANEFLQKMITTPVALSGVVKKYLPKNAVK
jgi:CheY-like chemotaxis protein